MAGKHVASRGGSFYRDLGVMLALILGVAAFIFFGLRALSGGAEETTTLSTLSAVSSTTTTAVPTTTTTAAPTTVPASTTTTAPLRAPADIAVLVLNSTGVTGLASVVSDQVGALGYRMLTPGNYQPVLEQTRIWFQPGFGGEAIALAAQFPDALIEENQVPDTEANIVIVVGNSYQA